MSSAITPELRERAGKDRPIIFSAPMVRALIEGRKSQTRRVLRWQPDPVPDYHSGPFQNADGVWGQTIWEPGNVEQLCSLRLPAAAGDRLWVKEEARRSPDLWAYSADGSPVPWPGRQDLAGRKRDICNSMFLPRSCSRLTLEVTEVRVERLAFISREDAVAEGATSRQHCYGYHGRDDGWSMDWSRVGQSSRWAVNRHTLTESDIALWCPQDAFGAFINELHDPRWNHKGDGIFGANPWVAAISFRVILANIDAPPASPLATGEAA